MARRPRTRNRVDTRLPGDGPDRSDGELVLLARLARLVERREREADRLGRRESWLLNRAIQATFFECVEVGATRQACAIVEEAEARRWQAQAFASADGGQTARA